jgi:hypothetical protein
MKSQCSACRIGRSLCAAAVVAASLAAAPQVRGDEAVYKATLPSTTWIVTKVDGTTSKGTGVLVNAEKKLVVTNFHVVGEARTAIVFFPDIRDGEPIVTPKHYTDNYTQYSADLNNEKSLGILGYVRAVDRKRDLAVVELSRLPEHAKEIKFAEKSTSGGVQVHSIGNPATSQALWVYTNGTVRSVYPKKLITNAGEHEFKVVETDAPINEGDSGGPVVNTAGELVAITQAYTNAGRLVSYSVDVTEVRKFLESPFKLAPRPLTEALTASELEFKEQKHPTGDFCEVNIEQKDKEKQMVIVAKRVEFYERAEIRKVWSLAAVQKQAPTLELAMKLLDENSRTKLGAWSVEKTSRNEYLIIYCVKLDATASAQSLRSAIEHVAERASEMKKSFAPTTATKATGASDTSDTDGLK